MTSTYVGTNHIQDQQKTLGKAMIFIATILLVLLFITQALHKSDNISVGFENWRPILYAYLLWSIALCWGILLIKGERGQRALFVLPAFLFTIAMVIFPLIFSVYISLHDL
ncbi:MAG TPA: hypothetical protein EYN39_11030 [Deltaproteobacteria bacterium]|nr:hypothetical protein [Deltaproteobacteria bacterium]